MAFVNAASKALQRTRISLAAGRVFPRAVGRWRDGLSASGLDRRLGSGLRRGRTRNGATSPPGRLRDKITRISHFRGNSKCYDPDETLVECGRSPVPVEGSGEIQRVTGERALYG